MTSVKEGRCKRWSEEMATLDFTHSSRRVWSLLRKLGGATHSKRQQPKVTANEVAHQLLLNGYVQKVRKQVKHLLKQQREASNLSQAFTTDEIINALNSTKSGEAAGPDGVFPDMLKNIGPAAIRWLQAFYDDVVTTAYIPKIWRSTNVIAIRKRGKPLDDPTSYRPISLLCCCHKLLERLLLTRLAPVFQSIIPPEQTGFRKKTATRVIKYSHLHLTSSQGFKRSSRPALCWSTWALRMTLSGRLGSWWSYRKPSSAGKQSD